MILAFSYSARNLKRKKQNQSLQVRCEIPGFPCGHQSWFCNRNKKIETSQKEGTIHKKTQQSLAFSNKLKARVPSAFFHFFCHHFVQKKMSPLPGSELWLIIIITAGGFTLLVSLFVILYCFCWSRRPNTESNTDTRRAQAEPTASSSADRPPHEQPHEGANQA